MKSTLLLLLLLCITSVHAQLQITEKKGKYNLLDEKGTTLLKNQDSIAVPGEEHEGLVISRTDGFYHLWKVNNGAIEEISNRNYSDIYVSNWDGGIYAEDFYGNEFFFIPGINQLEISDPYLNTVRYCRNNTGKYAICTSDTNLTGYDYRDIYYLNDKWLQAETDSGTILIDTIGNLVYGTPMDRFFISYDFPEILVGKKGNSWMIHSFDGSISLPLTELKNGWSAFFIDDAVYADPFRSHAVAIKDHKQGIIQLDNQTLVPFHYDELYLAYAEQHIFNGTYEAANGELTGETEITVLSLAIGRKDSNSTTWFILGDDFEERLTVEADQWIDTYDHYGIFRRNGEIIIYDLLDGSPSDFIENESTLRIYSPFGEGIMDSSGTVIVPFEYEDISRSGTSLGEVFIAGADDHVNLFDAEGNQLNDRNNYIRISEVCFAEPDYFRIVEETGKGIAYLNPETRKLEVLIPTKYQSISCFSLEPDKPLATGTKADESEYYLYRDGREIRKPEE